MDQAGQPYRHPENVWPAPCGCAAALALSGTAYRFCQPHADIITAAENQTQAVSVHVRWLNDTHAAQLTAFYAEHTRPVETDG